jgi:hypothetical protein
MPARSLNPALQQNDVNRVSPQFPILVRRQMPGYGMNAALLPDGMTGSVIED